VHRCSDSEDRESHRFLISAGHRSLRSRLRRSEAGSLDRFLYFEDGREVSFHDALVLFDSLQGCQANPRGRRRLHLRMVPRQDRPLQTLRMAGAQILPLEKGFTLYIMRNCR
jgi:hypothetical protein